MAMVPLGVSRIRAMHDESWKNLEEALETGNLIKGYISGKLEEE